LVVEVQEKEEIDIHVQVGTSDGRSSREETWSKPPCVRRSKTIEETLYHRRTWENLSKDL
jgi:hypothetical protein